MRGDRTGSFDAEKVELFEKRSTIVRTTAPLAHFARKRGQSAETGRLIAGTGGNEEGEGRRTQPWHVLAQQHEPVGKLLGKQLLLHEVFGLLSLDLGVLLSPLLDDPLLVGFSAAAAFL